jgi:hypothetical protein
MARLNWQGDEDHYWLELDGGRADIRSKLINSARLFVPQVYDRRADKNLLPGEDFGFADFKTAESVLVAQLITLDKAHMEDAAFKKILLDALDQAIGLIPDKPKSYRVRLENIKHWLLYSLYWHQHGQVDGDWVHEYQDHEFEWEHNGAAHKVMTPFGSAAIVEVGGDSPFSFGSAIHHYIYIQDESGVEFKDMVSYLDFLEAEQRLREHLTDLSRPIIGEAHLDYINFIFEICFKRFPLNADPMLHVRLSYIRTSMWETLP